MCDFITSLTRLTPHEWVFDKYEYLIFSCIRLNNEHPLSFDDVTKGEVNVETDEFFDVEILPLLKRL